MKGDDFHINLASHDISIFLEVLVVTSLQIKTYMNK